MTVTGVRKGLILFPLAGLALWAALAYSYLANPDACDDALWTSGWWFFLPPLLALPGFRASRPYAAGSVIAAVALLAGWSLSLIFWLISAIGCGLG
jgi:hypothetical protein